MSAPTLSNFHRKAVAFLTFILVFTVGAPAEYFGFTGAREMVTQQTSYNIRERPGDELPRGVYLSNQPTRGISGLQAAREYALSAPFESDTAHILQLPDADRYIYSGDSKGLSSQITKDLRLAFGPPADAGDPFAKTVIDIIGRHASGNRQGGELVFEFRLPQIINSNGTTEIRVPAFTLKHAFTRSELEQNRTLFPKRGFSTLR